MVGYGLQTEEVRIFINFSPHRFIAEGRPYWWVMETSVYTIYDRPELRQTYLTCETSAGSPSGHSMLFATTLYVAMQETLQSQKWYRTASGTVKYCTWNVFITVVTLVAISRMYFACHFLHQCLLGIVLGIAVGHFIRQPHIQRQLIKMPSTDALVVGLALVLLMITAYFGQILFEIDPLWSVHKVRIHKSIRRVVIQQLSVWLQAFNWCKDPFFVKPETTPVYGLSRLFGLLFGIVLLAPHTMRYTVHSCPIFNVRFLTRALFPHSYESISDATHDWISNGASL